MISEVLSKENDNIRNIHLRIWWVIWYLQFYGPHIFPLFPLLFHINNCLLVFIKQQISGWWINKLFGLESLILLFPKHGLWVAFCFLLILIAKIFHMEWSDSKLQDIASFHKQTLLSLEDNPALIDDIIVDINKGVPVRLFQLFRFSTYKSVKDAIWTWFLRKTWRQRV